MFQLNQALACDVEAEPVAYTKLAEIYTWACKTDKDLETNGTLDSDKRQRYRDIIFDYRKRAADKDLNHAESQYVFGKYVYFHPQMKPNLGLEYLKRAVTLDPTNIRFAAGFVCALTSVYGEESKEVAHAVSHLKSIGGNVTQDYWEDDFS